MKTYNKQKSIEKAVNVFWRNGYANTSIEQLENEMGVDKSSIYSSFGSKVGLLQESIKCYTEKLYKLVDKLKNEQGDGIEAIKQFFYDFVNFSRENNKQKGCLLTNINKEYIYEENVEIKQSINSHLNNVREAFAYKLRENGIKSEKEVAEKTNYLFISMYGFTSATKIFTPDQLGHYVSNVFKQL